MFKILSVNVNGWEEMLETMLQEWMMIDDW